jgi:TonB family protein
MLPPRSSKLAFGLAAFLLCPPTRLLAMPDDSRAQAGSLYADNAAGLHQLLLDMLAAAKSGDKKRLTTLIKETEVPNYERWYTSTFGQEKGESWAEPYGKMLDAHEKEFEEHITELAHRDGKVSVKKIDANKLFDTLNGRLDLFLADFEQSGEGKEAKTDHIGYFFFIDGNFRWDSNVEFIKVQRFDISNSSANGKGSPNGAGVEQSLPASGGESVGGPFSPGKNGVGFPSCMYCPVPEYTAEAMKAKFQGSVVLQLIVGPDGLASNIQILKSPGLGLDEKAIEAVRSWRFKPASATNGRPVAVAIPVEVTFRKPQ